MILYMLRDSADPNGDVHFNAHGRATYTTLANAERQRDKANRRWRDEVHEYEIVSFDTNDLEVVADDTE